MAFAQSAQKAQIPIGCQFCDSGTKIEWKCVFCSLLLCSECKDIHLKATNSSDHKIVDIKEVRPKDESKGLVSFSEINCPEHYNQLCVLYCKRCDQPICIKCVTKTHKGHNLIDEDEYNDELNEKIYKMKLNESMPTNPHLPRVVSGKANPQKYDTKIYELGEQKPTIKVTRKYTTDFRQIYAMVSCSYDSLWISDLLQNVMKNVKLKKDNIQIITEFNIPVYDMTTNSNNNLLVSVSDESRLKILTKGSGQISRSKYNVEPLCTWGIHVTMNQKIIIGAKTPRSGYRTGSRLVIVMDETGNNLQKYEHDKNNKLLFTLPYRITSTSNGNIWVVDVFDEDGSGRVVVLGQTGNIIRIYNGNPDVNSKERPFNPTCILTTPADNIIVADCLNHALHILNSEGTFVLYIRTDDEGIRLPHALALSGQGHFYIGCSTPKRSPYSVKANLYQVKYSGF
ncbi:uncharacterized protein LOC127709669 [Mytilus californianus]|uniref:uncharacterized protein LOC127709669 n=1 Tax=Mytilus californianus TaxID=6549 RepID=UPI0022484ED6|nr:uncharacterized protein LOC127709669 [Mytilus californianus]